MNIYDTIIAIKAHLTAHGLTCSVDPYAQVDPPFVLIEAEKTQGTGDFGSGGWIKEVHTVSITCIVSAQGLGFTTYKNSLSTFVENVMSYLMDTSTIVIKPIDITYNELMISSLKCSGAAITVEVYS